MSVKTAIILFCVFVFDYIHGTFPNVECDDTTMICDCGTSDCILQTMAEINSDISNYYVNCPIGKECHIKCSDTNPYDYYTHIPYRCQGLTINASLSSLLTFSCIGRNTEELCSDSTIIFPDEALVEADQIAAVLIQGTKACKDCKFEGKISDDLNQTYTNNRDVACMFPNACLGSTYTCGSGGECALRCTLSDCTGVTIDAQQSNGLLVSVGSTLQDLTDMIDYGQNICPTNGDCDLSYGFKLLSKTDDIDCDLSDEYKASDDYSDFINTFWCESATCNYNAKTGEYTLEFPRILQNCDDPYGWFSLTSFIIDNKVLLLTFIGIVILSCIIGGYINKKCCIMPHKKIRYQQVGRESSKSVNEADLSEITSISAT